MASTNTQAQGSTQGSTHGTVFHNILADLHAVSAYVSSQTEAGAEQNDTLAVQSSVFELWEFNHTHHNQRIFKIIHIIL